MTQAKVKTTLPITPVSLPDDTQDYFYASDEPPDLTPEEIARDWELLQQYEAENGPIVPSPPTRPIDPSQITVIHATPMPRRRSKQDIPPL